MEKRIDHTANWAGKRSTTGSAFHPVHAHCADVAAMFLLLAGQQTYRNAFQRILNDPLTPAQAERLAVLAALHDAGKYAPCFQERIQGHSAGCGHVAVLGGLFQSRDTSQRFLKTFPWLVSWDARGGTVVGRLLDAVFSHHGDPRLFILNRSAMANPWLAQWQNEEPFAGLRLLADHLPRWFPLAFGAGVPPLPDAPMFSHLFAGLVMLADWLGSDTRFFPFCGQSGRPGPEQDPMPFAGKAARKALVETGMETGHLQTQPLPDFSTQFAFAPYPMQARMDQAALDPRGSLHILEAETGSGKTEAALRLFTRLFHAGLVDSLFFACPLRFAATQLHKRVRQVLARTYATPPPVVLAVPGYFRFDDSEGYRLPDYTVLWNEQGEWIEKTRGWASEHPKRYLTAPVAVGTIDQALLAGMRVGHAALRAAGLARSLLVVDEVHASDVYMGALTGNLLRFLRGAGGHVLLMSATLGGATRQMYLDIWNGCAHMPDRVPGLAECLDAPYPVLWSTCADPAAEPARGSRAVHPRLVPLDAEDKALEHAADCARKGACVLVLRNKVDTATQSARHLETLLADAPELLFTVHGVLTLHHSRFTRPDRRLLDNAVEARFGKGGTRAPGVLVATQTLEQSLDVDFDVIITDLCPIDVLLQRIGRLQRHRANDPQRPLDFRTATCLVLAPSNGAELLDEPVQRVLNAGLRRLRGRVEGRAYTDLRVLTLTLNLLHEAADTATPWRIPRDNRRLVESATHPERLEACNALGPEWEKHGQYVEGQRISHGQQALICLIDWSKPYGLESAGIQEDEAVRTRLGLDDVSIPFPDGIPGPFGNMVDKLTIPRWMAPEAGPDHAPTQITAHDGDVRFHFAGHWFRYGRHGLHKEEQ